MELLEHQKTIKIIGKETQTIQIYLNKNDKIMINKQFLLYASFQDLEEIKYKDVDSLISNNINMNRKDENKIEKVDDINLIRLKNPTNNFEYIGLTKGGKIMKINPILYDNLYIKLDCILCFDDGIEIVKDKDKEDILTKVMNGGNRLLRGDLRHYFLQGNIINLNNSKKFGLIKTKTNYDFLNEEPEKINLINFTSCFKDYLYLGGRSTLIEKRLGVNESMILMSNSIVAFEGKINFSPLKKDNNSSEIKYVNDLNDIIVEGPGLVIFEPCERVVPIVQQKKIFSLIIVSLIFFALEIITQLVLTTNFRNNAH